MNEQINVAEALQDELAIALQDAMPTYSAEDASRVVAPLVRYLQQQYGGERIYIPKPFRTVTADALRQARARGESVEAICRQFGIARRTFYGLLAR